MATGSGTGSPISGGALWADTSDGDTYFAARHGIGTLWSGLTSAQKTALLTTAQADIENSGRYTFVDADGVAVDVAQSMKDAVCEQALMRLLDPDVDLRAIVQAQGVVAADEVGEQYSRALLEAVPLAPRIAGLLTAYVQSRHTGTFLLTR